MRERRTQQKKQKQRHYFSSKYPLICINTAISIFRSLRCGLTMTLLLWARATRDRLAVRSHPPESVLKSGPSSLNHHHQKVNYLGRRTQGSTSTSFPYPDHQSFWQPNHRQLIGFGGEGDFYINNSLCPWLHLISSVLQKKVRPHWCTEQATKCNAWMEMNLSRCTTSFSASLPLLSSYLFLQYFFSPLSASIFILILVGWW